MDIPKNILLMTATILPMAAGGNVTRRADPAERRADYEAALRFYLSLPSGVLDGILFCENSGSDLQSLAAIASRENPNDISVTFVSTASDCSPAFGKGHAELLMMDRTYETHIAHGDPRTRYWKVTGRLIFPNLAWIVREAPSSFDVYVDLRLVPRALRVFGTDRWADTRLFAFTCKGYREQFFGMRALVGTPQRQHLKNSHVSELMLFEHLYEASMADPKIVPRLCTQPVMVGVGAESLKDYNALSARAKNVARRFTRRYLPSLWL